MSSCRALRNGILLVAISASACTAGGPSQPEAIEVPVRLIASEAAGISGPIRLALAWRQGTGADQRWFTTFDTGLATIPESTRVSFDLPAAAERSALTDVTRAYVSCDADNEYPIEFSAAIPRLVAYEDSDQSGDFDPDLPLKPGQDRVLAVAPSASASSSIAAFTNLDAVLARLPMEYAECIRSYTGGRYSAFFIASQYSDYVWAMSGSLSATLELSKSPYAAVAMACDSSDVYSLVSQTPMLNKARSTLVDARVASDVCLAAPWQCTRADITTLPTPAPTLAYPGFSQFSSCTAVGNLDVLWYVTETVECTGCECEWQHSHQSWVVNASETPAGWPCGKQVKYCGPRTASIFELPEYCTSLALERPE